MKRMNWVLLCLMLSGATSAATTIRVNLKANGDEATGGNSFSASVSADGNKVAFSSLATNLDPLDTNTVIDVYLKDLTTGSLKLVSIGANGVGTASSNLPQISADGNFIAFVSTSANLVANDTNAVADVFVYKVSDATIERVSVANGGTESNGSSGACVSNCFSISSDGRFVAFESSASNLAALDPDTTADIYLRDRQTGTTTLVSQTSAGALGSGPLGSNKPSISASGRFIAFESSRVLEASDTNNTGDIYLRDTTNNTTVRVNTSASGGFTTAGFSARPSISADGNVVAFRSLSNELVLGDNSGVNQRDVFVKNLITGAIVRATPPGGGDPNGDSNEVVLSGDGNVLIFHSGASNLVAADSNNFIDVFRMVVASGVIERISVATAGTEGGNDSIFPDTNVDGSASVFESSANNLVVNDTNARTDVFQSKLSSDSIFANGFEF
jgi:Tol biopolymer transport system component